MKSLFCGALLLLAAFSGKAQAVRYSTQGHLAIESQPALGYERPEYLGMGDSVRVLNKPTAAIPAGISANMRQHFVYVSYPTYRKQPAGQGWVLRRGLVSTADSLLLNIPAMPTQTITTTKVVTTRRYVPVQPGSTAAKAGAKASKATLKSVRP
jgi:hypothetical protein